MKIAFTSCAKIQKRPDQPVWKAIEKNNPDLLLLLGDNVYGGTLTFKWKKFHRQLETRYKKQLNEKNFKKLVSKVPFKAIWDDHDFARGDNGKGALIKDKYKNKSRDLFHKYMNCSTNLPEVYYSFERDNVKFIMLDVRYYREEPSRNGSILGKKQEQWLKKQLVHNKKYTVICSGTTLSTGSGEQWSKYKNYYKEFRRLVKNANNVLFLSGDIHKNKFKNHGDFFEVISSGAARRNKDNYGIVNLIDDRVEINLYGNKKSDDHKEIIDTNSWKIIDQVGTTENK